jgi:hypothetical protein
VYAITTAGRNLMKEKVRSQLAHPHRIASPFDLGIVYNQLLSRKETVACLRERMMALDRSMHALRARQAKQKENRKPYFVLALSDRALAHLTTEKTWVEHFIREVERNAAE